MSHIFEDVIKAEAVSLGSGTIGEFAQCAWGAASKDDENALSGDINHPGQKALYLLVEEAVSGKGIVNFRSAYLLWQSIFMTVDPTIPAVDIHFDQLIDLSRPHNLPFLLDHSDVCQALFTDRRLFASSIP